MHSRRRFILVGATFTAVTLAGCSGSSGDDENTSDDGENVSTGDGEDGDSPENGGTETATPGPYTELTPVTTDRPIVVNGSRYQQLRAAGVDNFGSIGEILGTKLSNIRYDTKVGFGGETASQNGYQILQGDFDVDTVVSALEADRDGEQVGEYSGFQTVESGDIYGPVRFGVSEEAVVTGSNRDRYEFGIDVLGGDHPSLAGNDSDFATVTTVLENPDLVSVSVGGDAGGIPGGPAIFGIGFHVAPESSAYTGVAVYESERETTEQQTRFEAQQTEDLSGLSDLETRVDGDTLVTTGTIATSEIIW